MKRRTWMAIERVIASSWFWRITLGFFVIEAAWIALSAVYPMAFDEDFHLGIIKIYAGQWLPFFDHTPAGSQVYGAIIQDPSYLYHYLMSFPYRFFTLFAHNQTVIIILLRFINVALAAISLVLFRKVLLRAGAGKKATHLLLAVFVLIPIFPLMAGQINYDNLFLLMVAWVCLLVEHLIRTMRQKQLPLTHIIITVSVCLLASLVKYAFLPIFLAAGLFIMGYAVWVFRGHFWKTLGLAWHDSWHSLTLVRRILLCLLLIVSVGLFTQRYVVNIVSYHTLIPDCGKVLDNEACQQYSPWNRDYVLEQEKPDNAPSSPILYMAEWLYGMWYRLFFMINGNVSTEAFRYQNYPPLPVIGFGSAALFLAGIVAVGIKAKRVFFNNPTYIFFGVMTIIYVAVLWFQNYGAFLRTGEPVAINGRYLLPVLLPFGAIMIRALSLLFKKHPAILQWTAIAALLIFLQGGGVFSFIVRSNDHWYWQNKAVQLANTTVKRVISPLTVGSGKSIKIPTP